MQSETGRSDPSNLDRDEGPNPLDMRHNFTGNIVYTSTSESSNPIVRGLLNGNEIGVLLQFNSGLPLNIAVEPRSQRRRRDQRSPAGRRRATRCICRRARTSTCATRARFPLHGSVQGAVIAELKNVFNTPQMAGITTTIADRRPGQSAQRRFRPIRMLFPNPSGYEQRKFQLGFKVRF